MMKDDNFGYWLAEARYADGTEIKKYFLYSENGNYNKEEERKYNIECWLLEAHDDPIFYSVDYTEFYEG